MPQQVLRYSSRELPNGESFVVVRSSCSFCFRHVVFEIPMANGKPFKCYYESLNLPISERECYFCKFLKLCMDTFAGLFERHLANHGFFSLPSAFQTGLFELSETRVELVRDAFEPSNQHGPGQED